MNHKNFIYQNLTSLSPNSCIYCGAIGDLEKDHHPPLARIDDYRTAGGKLFIIVTSCRECNNLLRDKLTANLKDRCELVRQLLSDKYKKKLSKVNWTQEELNELGDTLRGTIIASLGTEEYILRRLTYQRGMDKFDKYIGEDDALVTCFFMEEEAIVQIHRSLFNELSAEGRVYGLNHKLTRMWLKSRNL